MEGCDCRRCWDSNRAFSRLVNDPPINSMMSRPTRQVSPRSLALVLEMLLRQVGGQVSFRRSLLNGYTGELVEIDDGSEILGIATKDRYEGRWNPRERGATLLTHQDVIAYADMVIQKRIIRADYDSVPLQHRDQVKMYVEEVLRRAAEKVEAHRREQEDLAELARLEEEAKRQPPPQPEPRPSRVPRKGIQRG